MNFLVVFVGAGIGGACRFLMGPAVQRLTNGWLFPIGTFSVNMLGCFLIGLLGQLAETKGVFQAETRLFIFVGLLGGFTTFSSYAFETMALIRDGQFFAAAANAVLQVILGLVCVWLGAIVGRLL